MRQQSRFFRGAAAVLALAVAGSLAACSSPETGADDSAPPTPDQTAPDVPSEVSFDLIAEVLDGGEQVVSVALDTSAIPDIDPASIDADTFTVHVASTSPIEGLGEGEIGSLYDGDRVVTGAEVEDGRVVIDLEHGFDVQGANTLGFVSFDDGTGRNVMMDLAYTVTQNAPFTAGGADVSIEQFSQGNLVSPEVDAFDAAVSAEGLNYRLYAPEDVEGAMSLVMWLHGNGEGGIDEDEYNNESQLRANRGGLGFATPEAQEALAGAYVLAPQVPDTWYENPEQLYHDRLNALIDEVIAAHPDIDPNRIYVVGASAGGFMSVRFAGEHPDKVAAVVPIAPALWINRNDAYSVTEEEVLKIKDLPSWFIHARNDDVIDYEKSTVWAYDLLSPSGNVELTSYDDVVREGVEFPGHFSWIWAARNDPALEDGTHLWEWLGQQSK